MDGTAERQYKYNYFNVTFPAEYVAHVEINRPEKLNAFIEEMWLNIRQIFNRLSEDKTVRVILLSGAGDRAFTAGLDVQAASTGGNLPLSDSSSKQDPARVGTYLRRHILDFQDCITAIERCPKPVISLMHGYSFGLAIDMSAATCIRLCTPSTVFSVREVKIGIAADIGTLTRLPYCVGNASWVREAAYTGREISSEEAERVGLVSRVVKPASGSGLRAEKAALMEEGLNLAKDIASMSPVAVQGTKEILNWGRGRTVDEGLHYTAIWNAAMAQTKDFKDAILSGIQKRKPTFEKL